MADVQPLIEERAIAARVDALAQAIAETTPGPLTLVSLLRGSFIFTADLIRALHRHGLTLKVDFMMLSSYGAKKESTGTVMLHHHVLEALQNEDVLIVDDILESGRTLEVARRLLVSRGARRVRIAVLLEKPGKRAVEIEAEFVGFTVEDVFVVGYGLDAASSYRELPYIGVVA